MITGLVLAEGSPNGVAVTLGALVPGVVKGLIGDAVVIARQADAAVANIAEIAGAGLVIAAPPGEPWRAGMSLARREWLLCLRAGDVPGEGWMRAVDRFLAGGVGRQVPIGRFSRPWTSAGAVALDFAERAAGTRTVRAGDLVRRDWLLDGHGGRVRPGRIQAVISRDVA